MGLGSKSVGARGMCGMLEFMTKRLEARAEEDGEQCSGSLAMDGSAPPRQYLSPCSIVAAPAPKPRAEMDLSVAWSCHLLKPKRKFILSHCSLGPGDDGCP